MCTVACNAREAPWRPDAERSKVASRHGAWSPCAAPTNVATTSSTTSIVVQVNREALAFKCSSLPPTFVMLSLFAWPLSDMPESRTLSAWTLSRTAEKLSFSCRLRDSVRVRGVPRCGGCGDNARGHAAGTKRVRPARANTPPPTLPCTHRGGDARHRHELSRRILMLSRHVRQRRCLSPAARTPPQAQRRIVQQLVARASRLGGWSRAVTLLRSLLRRGAGAVSGMACGGGGGGSKHTVEKKGLAHRCGQFGARRPATIRIDSTAAEGKCLRRPCKNIMLLGSFSGRGDEIPPPRIRLSHQRVQLALVLGHHVLWKGLFLRLFLQRGQVRLRYRRDRRSPGT